MDTLGEPGTGVTASSSNKPALFHSVSRLSCFLGGVFLVVVLVAICFHILSRLLGLGVAGGDEIAKYAMAFSGFFGFAYAFAEKAQVRVDFVLNLIKGRARRDWEVFLSIILGIGIALLIYYWGRMTYSSFKFDSIITGYIPVKVWMLQAVLLVGLVIFLVQIVLYVVSLLSRPNAVLTTTESAL